MSISPANRAANHPALRQKDRPHLTAELPSPRQRRPRQSLPQPPVVIHFSTLPIANARFLVQNPPPNTRRHLAGSTTARTGTVWQANWRICRNFGTPLRRLEPRRLRGSWLPHSGIQGRGSLCDHRRYNAHCQRSKSNVLQGWRARHTCLPMRQMSTAARITRHKLELAMARSSRPSFSAPVLAELEAAGWTPDRSIDIPAWIEELEPQGYRLSEPAGAALRSFGGLEFGPINRTGPNFSNDEPFNIDPILAGSGHYALAEELEREIGGSWFPLGEWLSHSSVFISDRGRVVATGLGWIWDVGSSMEDAIEFALMAHRPLRCLKALSPGAKPWPPEES